MQRALAAGLVNELFETQEALLQATLQCAQEIASKPPVAVWGSKQAIQYARDHSVDDSLKQMGWLAARRHLEQRQRARSRHGHEGKAPRSVCRPEPLAVVQGPGRGLTPNAIAAPCAHWPARAGVRWCETD